MCSELEESLKVSALHDCRHITIAGGGLAGLALGIQLGRSGVDCSIVESGTYPRTKVCGEFLSGSGLQILKNIAPATQWESLGAVWAHSAAFYSRFKKLSEIKLPAPALCLSRWTMDAALAEIAKDSGCALQEKARWTDSFESPGLVDATGREPVIKDNSGWRWIGLKAHMENVQLEADLEMHFHSNGYVGVNRIEHGKVNVCGLFRSRRSIPHLKNIWPEWLSGSRDSVLYQRLSHGDWIDDSFASINALKFGLPKSAKALSGVKSLRIGDAFAMIPPLTGNGMSMALEASDLAADPLIRFGNGIIDWTQCCAETRKRLTEQFEKRLDWANALQSMAFNPVIYPALTSAISLVPATLTWFFHKTRS